ncbi:MAG: hypothetical protein KC731_24630 [Myxococcales bacterium]|nr:hypothetical protein [Myxococcales bacterium]
MSSRHGSAAALSGAALLSLSALSTTASAATYQVGPSGDYPDIQSLLAATSLSPGDIVEVEGDHLYPGDLWLREEANGSADAPVTIRGIRKNGKRPTLEGVGTEQWHDMVLFLAAHYLVFEGFEIIGDDLEHPCIVTQANEIVVRDVYVHGCTGHGLLATDYGTGNLTIEHSEFTNNGGGDRRHQIYVTTDQELFPGSRVRIQFNYVHDAAGGHNLKSRAERTEVYFNWLENPVYNSMDLIGPDATADAAREDSDVVGNVIIHPGPWAAARIGDDGTKGTDGRYRFAYNTFVFGDSDAVAIRPQVNIESLELYNNAFISQGGAAPRLMHLTDYTGTEPIVMGSHNYIASELSQVPPELTDTLSGDPGVMDLASLDLRPKEGSALIDAGTTETVGPMNATPLPLTMVDYVPPPRVEPTAGMPYDRNDEGTPDIGAYAFGSGTEPGPGGPPPTGQGGSGPGGTGSGAGSGSGSGGNGAEQDGGCSFQPGSASEVGGLWATLLLGLGLLRRRRES